MRSTIYKQIVFWIDALRTWIEVVDADLYKEYVVTRRCRTDYLVSRTLVLRAFKARGEYPEGTVWHIPEHELDKALAAYRKQDGSFKSRIMRGSSYFTPADAEAIIRLATHGIVRLELRPRPVYIPTKPYYL